MGVNYTNWPYNIPNGHEIYQHLPFKGPPQFTQIGIFVLKTNHLATLLRIDCADCWLILRRLYLLKSIPSFCGFTGLTLHQVAAANQ
jgi:hypothetical protein